MPDTYISVGKLKKPHGLNGAFSFSLARELKSLKKVPPHFFVEIKGNFIPYFVKNIDLKDIHSGYISFEEITKPEEARDLVNMELYLEEQKVNTFFKKDADEYGFLVGFTAYDKETLLGTIDEVMDMPGQVLVMLTVNDQEVMIPLADDLVLDLDKRKKRITFDVPEGLIG